MSRWTEALLGKYDKDAPRPVIDYSKAGGPPGYIPNRMLPVLVPQPSEMHNIPLTSPYGDMRAMEIRYRMLLIIGDVLQLLPRAKEEVCQNQVK